MSQTQLSTTNMNANEPELVRLKRGTTEKQRSIADAIENHAIVSSSGEIDITPVADYIDEEHGDNYTSRGYIWQIIGKLFVVQMPPDDTDDIDNAMEYYRMGRRDEREQLRDEGKID